MNCSRCRLDSHFWGERDFLHSQKGISSSLPPNLTGQLLCMLLCYYVLCFVFLLELCICYGFFYKLQEEIEEQLEGKIVLRLFCLFEISLNDLVTRSGLGKDFVSRWDCQYLPFPLLWRWIASWTPVRKSHLTSIQECSCLG